MREYQNGLKLGIRRASAQALCASSALAIDAIERNSSIVLLRQAAEHAAG
jgi:C4-dicarboxylate transporter